MRRLMMCLGVVAFVVSPVMAGVSLLELSVQPGNTFGEGTCITPEGAFIGGNQSVGGVMWDVSTNTSVRPLAGSYNSSVSGIAWRTPTGGGPVELVVHGLNSGLFSMNATTDGGLTWSKRRWNEPGGGDPRIGATNTMQGFGGETVYATGWNRYYTQMLVAEMSGNYSMQFDKKSISGSKKSCMYGCSATGLAAGRRKGTTGYRNYKCQFDGDGGLSCAFFYGLHGSNVLDGTAWSVAADGSKIGGVSPVSDGRSGNWPYLSDGTPGGAIELPTYPDTGGSVSNGWVYGVSPNGDYACGHNYRGMEKAVLWDASDADPANWTITDLTELCDDAGALGKFTYNLRRAYAVTVADNGDILVTGRGVINDPVQYRGFLLTICEPIALAADILPNDDPNDMVVLKKADSKARLPIEVYGSEEFDVADVDLGSIRVAGTVIPVKVSNDGDENNDGYADLVIHVNRVDLINALDLSNEIGNVVDVVITGAAAGGCPCFEATDVVIPQAP